MTSFLSFLICGLEHSGTTMVSDLLREHPDVDSGFECGVLLCSQPSDFLNYEPFCNHMVVGWGLRRVSLQTPVKPNPLKNFIVVFSATPPW